MHELLANAGEEAEAAIKWLLARSDVEAADSLLDAIAETFTDEYERFGAYMLKFWPHFFYDMHYDRVYQEAGEVESKVDCFGWIPQTHRYQIVLEALKRAGRPQRVLDFGCSRAFHAIHLHNTLGTKFTCVDIDQVSIDQARAMIKKQARYPAGIEALVSDTCEQFAGQNYDAVMCLETLEHVPNIYPLLDQFERAVKPGGWIILTLPHGPVEFTMWVEHPERNREHLREIGLQDCYELWSQKPGFYLTLFAQGVNKYAGMTEGSIVVMYQADGKPCGQINMQRKILGALGCKGPELPGMEG